MAVTSKEHILHELRFLKDDLRKRYSVTHLGIFGSVARGEAGAISDIDIVVEMEPNLYRRASLRAELETRFGHPVDVIRYRDDMDTGLRNEIDGEACYV